MTGGVATGMGWALPGRAARGGDGLGGDGVGLGDARPGDEEGFADAAFVVPAFAHAQRRVGSGGSFGGGEAAVVAGENDDRVLVEVEVGEGFDNTTDGFIHAVNV